MAHLKKNQLNQILFIAVDATDFATVESGITASDFDSGMTKKFFGVNHGTSAAFTSGTISKAVELVRSGVFKQTLKAAECNYDFVLFNFKGHASMADLTFPFQTVTNDDSDIVSLLSDIESNIRSQFGGLSASVSDVHSLLSDHHSDFQSRVPKLVASQSLLSDVRSDIKSQIVVLSGLVSDVYSLLSDHHSDFQSRVPELVANDSDLSQMHSDLRSMISGITASVSASDISDIASRVWSEKYGAHSLASSFGSLFSLMATDADNAASMTVALSGAVSDVHSLLSDHHSDFQSRVPELVANDSDLSQMHSDLRSMISGITASVSVSDISDIASRVWSEKYRAHSLASSFGSLFSVIATETIGLSGPLSDVYSLLSDHHSDFQSRVPKLVALDSDLSNIHSDLRSLMADHHSDLRSIVSDQGVSVDDISDIASAVWSAKHRVHSLASSFGSLFSLMATDADNAASMTVALSDAVSDVGSKVAQALSELSQIESAIDSQFVYTSNVLSDLQSDLKSQASDLHSDLRSQISTVGGAVTVSNVSDIASRVWSEKFAAHSLASSFGSLMSQIALDADNAYSLLSDHHSDFQSRVPKLVANDSDLSHAHSDLRSLISGLTLSLGVSDISDIASRVWSEKYGAHSLASSFGSLVSLLATSAQLSNAQSDIRSVVSDQGGAVTVSDISNIASRVWSEKYTAHSLASTFGSLVSVMATTGAQANSRIDAVDSDVSSLRAGMVSQFSSLDSDIRSNASDLGSDLRSLIVANHSDLRSVVSDQGVSLSDISNIASRVWSEKHRVHSLASSFGSLFSLMATDADNAASMTVALSDAVSKVQAKVDTNSVEIGQVESALDSQFLYESAALSDIDSAITVVENIASDAHSAAVLAGARASDVQSVLANVGSQVDLNASRILETQSQVDANRDIASDAHSAALQANSRAALINTRLIDVESQIDVGVSVLGGVALTSAAQSDVVSAVWARAGSDPAGVPSVGASMGDKLDWIAALSRNKITQTSALQVLRNDADSLDIASAIVSDDGTTATRAEWA